MNLTASAATYYCKCCSKPFTARIADRARGWARFCSKRCKAIKQEARTGQNAQHREMRTRILADEDHDAAMDAVEAGWDGHKNVF